MRITVPQNQSVRSPNTETLGLMFAGLLLCAAMLSCTPAKAPETEFETYLRLAQEVWGFQGAVLVARNDSILVRAGYGLANIEKEIPNTPDIRFQIGSITKPFTAIAIMLLIESGKVSLDDPVTRHLKSYPSEPGDRITVRQLLNHTSGLPDYRNIPELEERVRHLTSVDDVIALFRIQPLLFAPGTRHHYSNPGYILLGRIIESASGMRYEDYIDSQIARPLKLESTGVLHGFPTRPAYAQGYRIDEKGELLPTPPIKYAVAFSVGSVSSTVDDLFKLHRALDSDVLLSARSRAGLFTAPAYEYGYGFRVQTTGGHRMAGHSGGSPGFNATFQRWIDDSVCVVVLSNTGGVPTEAIAEGLAGIALGERYRLPAVKRRMDIDRTAFPQFEGVYRLSDGGYRIITDVGDALIARTVNGRPYVILPEASDLFFYAHDPLTTIAFGRDSTGAIGGLRIRHSFDEQTAMRITGPDADSLFLGGTRVTLSPAALARFAGRYQLKPAEFVMTVSLSEDKLLMRAQGRPPLVMIPFSETEFGLRGLSARLIFTLDKAGVPQSVEYRHGGEVVSGTRL